MLASTLISEPNFTKPELREAKLRSVLDKKNFFSGSWSKTQNGDQNRIYPSLTLETAKCSPLKRFFLKMKEKNVNIFYYYFFLILKIFIFAAPHAQIVILITPLGSQSRSTEPLCFFTAVKRRFKHLVLVTLLAIER